MEREVNKPERDTEITLTLHNLISQISEDLPVGENFLGLDLKTELTHNKVFTNSNCKGEMTITSIDTLVGWVGLNCSEGCKNKQFAYHLNSPNQKQEIELPFFTITFEDIGYLSPEYSIDDKTGGYLLRPQILKSDLSED